MMPYASCESGTKCSSDHQQPDRLAEVNKSADFGMSQDRGRLAHVGVDDGRKRVAAQEVPAVREHARVVVHIDNP